MALKICKITLALRTVPCYTAETWAIMLYVTQGWINMEAQLLDLALNAEDLSTSAVLAAAQFQCKFANEEFEVHHSETMQLLLRRVDEAWILGDLKQPVTIGSGPVELLAGILLLPILVGTSAAPAGTTLH